MIDLSTLTAEQINAVMAGLAAMSPAQIAAIGVTSSATLTATGETPQPGAGVIARIVPRVRIMPPRNHDDPSTPEDDRVPRELVLDGEQVRFVDGTDHMHDGSVVSVEADYLDANGRGVRIDLDPSKTPPGELNHRELLGMIQFRAKDRNGRYRGSIGGTGLDLIAHVEGDVHWLDPDTSDGRKGPGAYRRSGGVWAECAVRGAGEVYTIEIEAPGGAVGRVILPRIG